MEVLIASTGTANTASVAAWLRRAGVTPQLTIGPEEVATAPALILPGVGAFGAAMAGLMARNLVLPLQERIKAQRPTLCICLGMQLLFDSSEESPGIEGLGVIPGSVRRLPPNVRVPHMGWNLVTPSDEGSPLAGYAYFANSYAVLERPDGWSIWTTDHGVRFVSAVARGEILACQFHPELSGAFGRALLDRWLDGVPRGACAC